MTWRAIGMVLAILWMLGCGQTTVRPFLEISDAGVEDAGDDDDLDGGDDDGGDDDDGGEDDDFDGGEPLFED